MRVYEIHDKCEQKLLIIESVIENKKNMLYENQHKIKSSVKENEFLEKVRDDYEKYFYYIAQQKNDQIKALEMLNEYIEKVKQKQDISHFNKIDAEKEQGKILKEIEAIQQSLDGIITDTKSLKNKLDESPYK
jgi:hypothetical protein